MHKAKPTRRETKMDIRKYIKRQAIQTLIGLTVSSYALAGAYDVSDASHLVNINHPIPPVDPKIVKIYTYKPSSDHQFIGVIYARGMASPDRVNPLNIFSIIGEAIQPSIATEEDDKQLAIDALINEAAKIGADSLIITKSYQVQITAQSSERRIEALAYRSPTPQRANEGTKAQVVRQESSQLYTTLPPGWTRLPIPESQKSDPSTIEIGANSNQKAFYLIKILTLPEHEKYIIQQRVDAINKFKDSQATAIRRFNLKGHNAYAFEINGKDPTNNTKLHIRTTYISTKMGLVQLITWTPEDQFKDQVRDDVVDFAVNIQFGD
jgi:uncharacterized protein YbjQ (UPF0145 family)